MIKYRSRQSCELCRHLIPAHDNVLVLPPTPLANRFTFSVEEQETFPLTLQKCSYCWHVQLRDVVDPVELFSDYSYESGTSPVFVKHFKDYAWEVKKQFDLGPMAKVADIGSNDGTLLKQFKELSIDDVVGFEPCEDLANKSRYAGIRTISDFLSRYVIDAEDLGGQFDVVTANNVFAHVGDIREFTESVKYLLHQDGVFVFEVSYLLDVVQRCLFDTIYHEHLSYHSVGPLLKFFGEMSMSLFRVDRISTHGGSIRCYVSKSIRDPENSVLACIAAESNAKLTYNKTYTDLASKIKDQRFSVKKQIEEAKSEGYSVIGYGAPAKLTTLMYCYDLSDKDIEFIVDDSPLKAGRYTPGKNVPVVPKKVADRITAMNDKFFVVVFAWNFFDSIITKLQDNENIVWYNPHDNRLVSFCDGKPIAV